MVAEIAGFTGLDLVVIDQGHGPLTAETTVGVCAAAERGGAAPVVRVRENAEGSRRTSAPRATRAATTTPTGSPSG